MLTKVVLETVAVSHKHGNYWCQINRSCVSMLFSKAVLVKNSVYKCWLSLRNMHMLLASLLVKTSLLLLTLCSLSLVFTVQR